MRRKFASIAITGLAGSLLAAVTPALAQNPVDIIIVEGKGLVCAKATGLTQAEYNKFGQYSPDDYIRTGGATATNANAFRLKVASDPGGAAKPGAWCNYPGNDSTRKQGNTQSNPDSAADKYDLDDPLNYGKVNKPNYWQTPPLGSTYWAENVWRPTFTNASGATLVAQGLFAPGLGPGARGPYELNINTGTTEVPKNVCISTMGGEKCITRTVGALTPAPINGFGAHAGSSQGVGNFSFTPASGSCANSGQLGWQNSAATILPTTGTITNGCGAGRSIAGFTSSRGVSGESAEYGDAGASAPTSGFQVEGMLVIYG